MDGTWQFSLDGTLPPDPIPDAFFESIDGLRQMGWEGLPPPDDRELAWRKQRRQFPPETDLDAVLGRLAATASRLDELRVEVEETQESLEGLARRAADLGAAWPTIVKGGGRASVPRRSAVPRSPTPTQ